MVQKRHEKEHAKLDTSVLSFDRFYLEVRIKYVVLVMGLFVTGILSYSYAHFSPPGLSLNEVIKNIILIVGAGVGLTSLIYTALSINAIRADKVTDTHIAKLTHSSEFVSTWYSPSMASNTTKVREHALKLVREQDATQREQLIQEMIGTHDLFVSAISVLNFLEHMAQELNYKLVDDHYLKAFFRDIVHIYYHSFLELIKKVRYETQTDNPFSQLEALEKRWWSGETQSG